MMRVIKRQIATAPRIESIRQQLLATLLSEQIRDWIRTSDGDYTKPPDVRVEETGAFANYMDHELGTIADYQAGRMGNPNQKLVVQRPYAKALLHDTMVDRVLTRPQNIDAETGEYISFGGKGLSN